MASFKITQDYFSLDWQRWMWVYLNFIHNIRVTENRCLMLEDVQILYTISEIIKFRQKKTTASELTQHYKGLAGHTIPIVIVQHFR